MTLFKSDFLINLSLFHLFLSKIRGLVEAYLVQYLNGMSLFWTSIYYYAFKIPIEHLLCMVTVLGAATRGEKEMQSPLS